MSRPANYNTKQREAVLAFIMSLGGKHVTAAQIVGHFESEKTSISRTTIYRHLEKLVGSGKVRKYSTGGTSGACFQYAASGKDCQEHFHLKCECCGELFHLQCDTLEQAKNHVRCSHDFEVNTLRTVFYGKCRNCLPDV